MTIIDLVLVAAAEPGKSLDQHRAVPHLQAFHLDMDINLFTDQSAGHRVGVVADADRAPLGDSRWASPPRVHAPRGQDSQC